MSMSLYLSLGETSRQFPLSMADLNELNALLIRRSSRAVGVLMGARDEEELGEPQSVTAGELRAAVAELTNVLSPAGATAAGGYAYSFQVTFPGQRPFEVEGLAKLRIGGEDCDVEGGFERCELRKTRSDGSRVTVLGTRDLRGEKVLRADDGTEMAVVRRRKKKKPDTHLVQTLREIDGYLAGVPDAERLTVVLG